MEKERIVSILREMGIDVDGGIVVTAFKSAEDGAGYNVWKIAIGDSGDSASVLKLASLAESEVFTLIGDSCDGTVPLVFATHESDGQVFILMEYVYGEPALRLYRENLPCVLDSLIKLQTRFLSVCESEGFPYSFDRTLESRRRRGTYLHDEDLLLAYEKYLSLYVSLPRTLCHDDLLPFNVIVSGEKAVLIDWEAAGILPYLTSVARLLAHGTEDEGDLFFLTDADREFAIRYYYDNFAYRLGVSLPDYRYALDCFLFYEYCEWVMLGNKYSSTHTERYRRYFRLAKDMAKKLNSRR